MWTRVRLAVGDADAAQRVATDLWSIGARGWERRDAETFSELDGSAFRGASVEGVELIAYFEASDEPPDLAGLLTRQPGTRLLAVHEFQEESWKDSWRQFFAPTRVSARLSVRPSWNDSMPEGDHGVVLIIDPGMAFGTGTHETTRLCLQALDAHLLTHPQADVLDVGCGSGILTMAAARLGAGRVRGVDNDPEAVRVARENWRLNELGTEEAAPFSVEELADVEEGWDLVLANILSGILSRLRDHLVRVTKPSGTLVLSGVLASERVGFVDHFVDERLEVVDEQLDGDWIALVLRRR